MLYNHTSTLKLLLQQILTILKITHKAFVVRPEGGWGQWMKFCMLRMNMSTCHHEQYCIRVPRHNKAMDDDDEILATYAIQSLQRVKWLRATGTRTNKIHFCNSMNIFCRVNKYDVLNTLTDWMSTEYDLQQVNITKLYTLLTTVPVCFSLFLLCTYFMF